MNVLITGATGLVGKEIVNACLGDGHHVAYLTTSKRKIVSEERFKGYYWDPELNKIDPKCFENVEVIINLAGATIAKRWTRAHRETVLNSRLNTVNLLFETLKKQEHSVRHFISASAIGIYPSSFQNYYTESWEFNDDGFLGNVVVQWENAMDNFSSLGLGVTKLRIGLVLSALGGAYPKIEKPIRLGVGAAFGTGKQWQSWIHLSDVVRGFLHVMDKELVGVFNLVAPNPVSNATMVRHIALQLEKKIRLPNVPKFVMQLVLGKMHLLLFASQRVSSKKIQETGFDFTFGNIQPTINELTK